MAVKFIHKSDKTKDQHGNILVVATHPYLRLAHTPYLMEGKEMKLTGASEGIYLQHGHFFDDGYNYVEPENIPEWVEAELKKISPKTLRDFGYAIDVEMLTEEERRDLTRHCDWCSKDVDQERWASHRMLCKKAQLKKQEENN